MPTPAKHLPAASRAIAITTSQPSKLYQTLVSTPAEQTTQSLRPQLRIIPSLPPSITKHPHISRQIHHSTLRSPLCKTAPLHLPSNNAHRTHAAHREAFAIVGHGSPLGPSPRSHKRRTQKQIPRVAMQAKGCRRRLSDKVKGFFFVVTRRKTNETEPREGNLTPDSILKSRTPDDNKSRRNSADSYRSDVHSTVDVYLDAPPARPHRSPGTASFYVNRPPFPYDDNDSASISTIATSSFSSIWTAKPQWAIKARKPEVWILDSPNARGGARYQMSPKRDTEDLLEDRQGLVSRFSDSSSSDSVSVCTLRSKHDTNENEEVSEEYAKWKSSLKEVAITAGTGIGSVARVRSLPNISRYAF
ncbi:hypothetical protein L204_103376 [Cryptococcus depauperatus]|nr:hypothetical protein L204_01694 [Cryptococcus depauperatus CBS 7855]